MNNPHKNKRIVRTAFIGVAIAIMSISTIFTNRLARQLSVEETKKVEIWSEATRQLILADEKTDISFLLTIIEDNTTIPVIMNDEKGNILSFRNIKTPKENPDEYIKKQLEEIKVEREPLVVDLGKGVKQYIYYDESSLLKQLQIFPYVQLIVVGLFFIIIILVFSSSKRAEQNRVWVGLSKETAHQLGTPISSMLAWSELLKLKYPSEPLILDMEKDVSRLGVIADRFSKIGSKPNLKPTSIQSALENAVQYIRSRSSESIKIAMHIEEKDNVEVNLNIPLFEWVVENICKNAIDAMQGSGNLDIYTSKKENKLRIDIQDTGKGIERNMYKTIFSPGFTTKQRGWGLGLSLAKRIIEEYHKGKIFVKESEINVGTTFRIILPIH
ncbi:MAG: ATP-binding protein [Paludibacter sp.]|nr:MAG: ATP-binding protein [Paludibacter sp.]